jgi:hypothetical protein
MYVFEENLSNVFNNLSGHWQLATDFGPFTKEPLNLYLADLERLMLIDFAKRMWTFPFLELPQICVTFCDVYYNKV